MKNGLGLEAPGCSMAVLPWCHLQTGERERERGCDKIKRVRITTKKKRSK